MICAARESGAKRTDKGTAGESRCRKATGLPISLSAAFMLINPLLPLPRAALCRVIRQAWAALRETRDWKALEQ